MAVRLAAAGVPWLLSGGSSLRLLGATRRPGDVDLEVRPGHASAAAAALGMRLGTDAGGGWSSLRALGTLGGMPVDLSAGVTVEGPGGVLPPDDDLLWAWAVRRRVGRLEVVCAPPEEALARALVAGDWRRIGRLAGAGGPAPRVAYVSRRLAASSAAR